MAPHTMFSQKTSGRIDDDDGVVFFGGVREGRDDDDDDRSRNKRGDAGDCLKKTDPTTRLLSLVDIAFAVCAVARDIFRASADLKPREMADDKSFAPHVRKSIQRRCKNSGTCLRDILIFSDIVLLETESRLIEREKERRS